MSPFSKTNDHPRTTVYLYERKEERDLIDFEDKPPQQQPSQQLISIYNTTMEVNIKFEDLIGDRQVSFIRKDSDQEKKFEKPTNVMQYMEVMDYIDKCNQTHALLMQQVAETRLQCRKSFYEFM
ncbi:hypothetical protein INT48_000871 [Thamnidium elegans]|uniref:Uncharacterized protein n=1 Tax=Thamnidium elegans TaxID=101142 RepID=A0A8H7VW16_9FUNG|nr:hypothetical protein INT48_000871 [Thamnidium elegans]